MRRLALVGSLLALSTVTAGWAAFARPRPPAGPGLDGALVAELDEWEWGQVAVGRYAVSNPGDQELVLDGVRSSCSCAGLEVDGDGEPKRLESLRLAPGGQAELMIRMTVNGLVGDGQSVVVYARTNRPDQPEVGFRLSVHRITGGIEVRPQGVAVGRVPIGGRAVHVVEVIDRSPDARPVARVTTVGDGITARLLPPDGPLPEGVVGRVEVTVDTTRSRPIDGQVLVWPTAVRPASPVGFAVSGRVVPPAPSEG